MFLLIIPSPVHTSTHTSLSIYPRVKIWLHVW